MTRVIATSDFHGNLPPIPECDLLLIAGDICPSGPPLKQSIWLDTTFRTWLEKIPATEIVIIAGNHDLIFEKAPELLPPNLRCHYLQDTSITLFGLHIYGTPWQLPFWGAFNKADHLLFEIYANIPENTDIIISHGPPYRLLDTITHAGKTIHTGSKSLLEKTLEIKPKLCLFGHIHIAYGKLEQNGIVFANVALVDDHLKVRNEPMTFEFTSV